VNEVLLWERFRAAAADALAWPALLVELEPVILAIARRQPIGRLRVHEDTPREIATRVFGRLHAHELAAVRKLCAMDPPPNLEAWLRVIVRRSAIDYMRESPEFERASDRWISLATLSTGAGSPRPDSLAEKRQLVLTTVQDMVARANREVRSHGDAAFTRLALEWKVERIHVRRLVTKGPQLVAVLVATLEGHSQTEIAESLAMTRREVELSIRYLEELLHARFAW